MSEDLSSHASLSQTDTLGQQTPTPHYTETAVHAAFQQGYNTSQV